MKGGFCSSVKDDAGDETKGREALGGPGRPGEAHREGHRAEPVEELSGVRAPRWDLSKVPRRLKCWGTEESVEDKNTGQARQASWAGPGARHGARKLSPALAAAAAVAFEPLYHLPDCQTGTFLTAWEGGQGSHGNRAKNPRKGEKKR